MPTKASITTRTAKGSPLSTAEMDGNLTNLRDQSIGIADDASTVLSVDSGSTVTIAGSGTVSTALSGSTLTVTGTGISASSVDTLTNKTINSASNTITITESNISDLGSYITASSTDTLTNKTIDANGTGNSITNLEVADLATGVLDTDLASVSASDDTLASAKAIKAYADTKIANVVEDLTPQLGGDLDVNGNQIVSVSNGNIILAPNGTGTVQVDNSILEVFDDTSAVDFANYGLGSILIQDTTTGANVQLAQGLVGPAITGSDGGTYPDNVQYFSVNFDTSGTYSLADSSAVNGDQNVSMGYDFTNSKAILYGGGGALNITAYGSNSNAYALQPVELAGSQVNAQSELVFDKTYKETITTLTDDSTTDIHIDCSATSVSTFSLNDNKTFVFTNLDAGRSHTLIITNQGSHTATLQGSDSSAVKFPGGAPTITTGAGSIDVITVFYDGTNYLGNIAQNFS